LSSLKPEVGFAGRIVFHSNFDGDHELYLLTKKGIKKLTDNTWDDVCGRWSPDGQKIAFAANPSGKFEIFTMKADGSQITQITTNLKNPIGHPGHDWTPDGRAIVYTVQRKRGFIRRHWMEIIDLKTRHKQRFIPEFKQSAGIPDFSPTAPLLAFTGKRSRGWDAALFNLQTRQSHFLTEGGKSCRPHFSHDGQKLAYVSAEADGKADIWLMNPDGTGKKRLTNRNETYDYFPAWSPDDRFIVFSSVDHYGDNLSGQWALYMVEVKTGRVKLLLDTPGADLFPHWTK
jgi:Tol biopolymer transport system component